MKRSQVLLRDLADEDDGGPGRGHRRGGAGRAGHRNGDATTPAPVRTRVASVQPKNTRPQRAGRSWTAALSAGDFDAILEDAERDIGRVLASRGTEDLAALADAARYRRHDDVARRALLAQRRRFAGSPRAADAAFFLGRLDENGGRGPGPRAGLVRTLSRRSAARLVRGRGAGPQDDGGRRASRRGRSAQRRRPIPPPVPARKLRRRRPRAAWRAVIGYARPAVFLIMALAVAALAPDVSFAQALPAPKVILLRPPAVPAAVSEALVRLQAELTVEGFDAQVSEVELGPDVRAELERLAPTMAATAVVAVVAGADPAGAELWVVDRMTGKTVVRRVHADPKAARIAEVLSVRAVELLRASFLELAITSRPGARRRRGPAAERPRRHTLRDRAARGSGARLDAGRSKPAPAAWARIQGASSGTTLLAEVLPVARVQRAFGARLCARVSFAGLGTQAQVDLPERLRERVADDRARRRAGAVPARPAARAGGLAGRGHPVRCRPKGTRPAPYVGGNAYRVSRGGRRGRRRRACRCARGASSWASSFTR